MKIDRTSPRAARARGAAAYARRVEAAAPADAVDAILPASVLGIPEAEFTPRVRDAIMGLMSEVDSLRRELSQTRSPAGRSGKDRRPGPVAAAAATAAPLCAS